MHLKRKHLRSFWNLAVVSAWVGTVALAQDYVRYQEPALFSYEELAALGQKELAPELEQRLAALRRSPFLSNEAFYGRTEAHVPDVPGLGPSLRIVQWNIERGLRLDDMKLLFTDKDVFLRKAESNPHGIDAQAVDRQIDLLQQADILVLNELDWGMKRTGYRHVVAELGQALRMNWVYGIEFVEVDPVSLGTEQFEEIADAQERQELIDNIAVDRERIRALHGTAILSRFPIRKAELHPF